MKWTPGTRLGIGTVEFGMPYGISGQREPPNDEEVIGLLSRAAEAKISLLDTAPSYGTSEDVLGRCLPAQAAFRIITKTPVYKDSLSNSTGADLQQVFHESLKKLRQSRLHGLLVHHADDLLADDGPWLWEALETLKSRRLVDKIGVSVYNPDQVERILARYRIDLIQIPFNVLDQRLAERGLLSALKKNGVEIHGRSVFLQGLLLMSATEWPSFINDDAKKCLNSFHQAARSRGLTPVQAALGFALQHPELDTVLIGFHTVKELNETLLSLKGIPEQPLDWSAFACSQEMVLDPRLWPAPLGGRG